MIQYNIICIEEWCDEDKQMIQVTYRSMETGMMQLFIYHVAHRRSAIFNLKKMSHRKN
jgi:hypothetical protein